MSAASLLSFVPYQCFLFYLQRRVSPAASLYRVVGLCVFSPYCSKPPLHKAEVLP